MPRKVGALVLADLQAAVDRRFAARRLRRVFEGSTLGRRIADRERKALDALSELMLQARALLTDKAELRESLANLRKLKRTIRRDAQAHRERLAAPITYPKHRPDDRPFWNDIRRIMAEHKIPPKLAARLLVERVAPGMSKSARVELLLPRSRWPKPLDGEELISNLAHRLSKTR